MDKHDQPWAGAVFVDGHFRPAADGGQLDIRDKASGEILGTAGAGTAADVDAAVASALEAQRDWAARTYSDRAAVLRRIAGALEADPDLRELIMRETGCIGGKADYEIGAAASELMEAAGLAARPVGEVLQTGHAGRSSVSERVPVGVVAVITPWNFPLVLGMRVIAPALALGNTVVVKPSPETPASGGLAIAQLFVEAGAPEGILQVVPGGEEVGRRMVEHPDVAMVHFTGSTHVGRDIARTAGGLLKKVSLELGGNNALVVLDDADLEEAAMIAAWSTFHYQGQTCITAGRHIVDRQVVQDYVDRLSARASAITVGNTVTEPVGLGPMINQTQIDRAQSMLDEAVAAGARVVTGGTVDGPFFRADRRGRRAAGLPAVERGDLRSDRRGPGRGRRRRSGRGHQRQSLRPGLLGAGRRPPSGQRGGPAAARRDGARQRRDPAGRGARALRRGRCLRPRRSLRW